MIMVEVTANNGAGLNDAAWLTHHCTVCLSVEMIKLFNFG
jgi:hypothetical protein